MNINLSKSLIVLCAAVITGTVFASSSSTPNEEAKQFKLSTTIEKERPELNDETKKLVSNYRRDPSETNRNALKKQVANNYDKVVDRKKAKLEELKLTAKHESKIKEMQEIVDEMIQNRESRIEQNMRRLTDSRLTPGSRDKNDGYLPVLGAGQNVTIAYTPVTNEDYSKFIKATGKKSPKGWKDGVIPKGKERHPVVNVSYEDAKGYCKWLSEKDEKYDYRLPTSEEWEYAAGHMPKDADFNCGEKNDTTPVDAYAKTLSASGAIDMWGNCWEWTSTKVVKSNTEKEKNLMEVKGGSWSSPRTNCRTEYKNEGRESSAGANDLGFRVIREKRISSDKGVQK